MHATSKFRAPLTCQKCCLQATRENALPTHCAPKRGVSRRQIFAHARYNTRARVAKVRGLWRGNNTAPTTAGSVGCGTAYRTRGFASTSDSASPRSARAVGEEKGVVTTKRLDGTYCSTIVGSLYSLRGVFLGAATSVSVALACVASGNKHERRGRLPLSREGRGRASLSLACVRAREHYRRAPFFFFSCLPVALPTGWLAGWAFDAVRTGATARP